MDEHGFVSLPEFLKKVKENSKWQWIDQKSIETVIDQDPKGGVRGSKTQGKTICKSNLWS